MQRPQPATIIAVVALFFALGGTSIAATQLAKNSVGTPQLKKNAVTSAKVKDGTLTPGDFSPAAKTALQGTVGPQGPQGATGADGARGQTGPAGPTFSYAVSEMFDTPVLVDAGGVNVIEKTVTLPRAGRFVVTVTGRFDLGSGPSVGNRAQAFCFVNFNHGETTSQITPSSVAEFQSGNTYVGGLLALTFYYNATAAGNLPLDVYCSGRAISGTPTLTLSRYDLTGVLTDA